jgi:hypothetical protein
VLLMCVEGAWWEPGRELQEKLEEKCGRYALNAAYTLVASSVGPHTLVASGVGPHTLVASSLRPHTVGVRQRAPGEARGEVRQGCSRMLTDADGC